MKDDAFRPREAYRERANGDGNDARFDGSGMIVTFGLPRSGTTWLAKLLDSHPDVLCRYEPDRLFRGEQLPNIALNEDDRRQYLDSAREFLRFLAENGRLGIAGPPPFYSKHYRAPPASLLRRGILYGFGALQHAIGAPEWLKRLPLPDLIHRSEQSSVRIAIKSVSLGRARLFAEACPNIRSVVIMRHPCGQVESEIRGVALGKFNRRGANVELARSAKAERMGLKVDDLESLTPVEQLAWRWAFWNQVMLDDFNGASRAKVIRYEDLAADPEQVMRELFSFSGLPWHPQTASFIKWSTSRDHSERYFQVMRDPAVSVNKWRKELSIRDQDRILDVACRVSAGRMFTR